MKTRLVILLLLFAAVLNAQQVMSFAELRALADSAPGKEIEVYGNKTFAAPGTICRSLVLEHDLFIEGFVLTEPRNPNKDLHYSIHYTTANSGTNDQCVYLVGLDGKYGLRLNFTKTEYTEPLQRYHRVKFNLRGGQLCREGDHYVVYGLGKGAIANIAYGDETTMPPAPVKKISELTDDDIFTYVTVKDCEFVFKDGAYVNIYEEYGRSGGPTPKGVWPNNVMNCWASVVCDDTFSDIYMLLNSRVKWRRSGTGVPQGKGNLSGILVKTYLPRYGLKGKYSIRPLSQQDVDFEFSGESSYKTIAEWNWGDNVRTFKTTTGITEEVIGQGILADIGKGELSVDLPQAKIFRGKDFNNVEIFPPRTPGVTGDRGAVNYGALKIATPGKSWWNWKYDCANSLVVNVSTAGLSGEGLYVAFTFSAGNQQAYNSSFYPSFWCVEYSSDGVNYAKVQGKEAVLRSLPWYSTYVNMKDTGYPTSSEAGMGFTEHMFPLPASLLGHEKIWIRISPSRKVVSTAAYRNQESGLMTPYLNGECLVNFGSVKVAYR